ncbi:hypothetical protein PR048_010143 [Dryococelus australis]|uniref:Uncharacterized protein n=1 Tax=Dryococelus australis TaxID=614101 RepID=A0ABQ9I2W4_9NEOP|nr:hypothetical protein PR048_010143 [Dryococelus australis]
MKLLPEEKLQGPKLKPGTIPSVTTIEKSLGESKKYAIKKRKDVVSALINNNDPTLNHDENCNVRSENETLVPNTQLHCIETQCELGCEVDRKYLVLESTAYNMSDTVSNISDTDNMSDTFSKISDTYNMSDTVSNISDTDNMSDTFSKISDTYNMSDTVSNISDTDSENVEGNKESEVGETETKVINMSRYFKGTMLCVKYICECDNELAWYPQPMNGKQPQGIALIAPALFLSGILVEPLRSFCKAIVFTNRNKPVRLAGDGQYDSPGFSVKYLVYSFMDLDTGLVVDFELVQKGMVKSELERASFENIMEKCRHQLKRAGNRRNIRKCPLARCTTSPVHIRPINPLAGRSTEDMSGGGPGVAAPLAGTRGRVNAHGERGGGGDSVGHPVGLHQPAT